MKDNVILALLKKRNQYLLQLLVIIIFMLILNMNEISFCAGIEPETFNNVEGLVYAQETQNIKQPADYYYGHNNPESNKAADYVVGNFGISAIVLGAYYIGKPFIVFSVIPAVILYIITTSL